MTIKKNFLKNGMSLLPHNVLSFVATPPPLLGLVRVIILSNHELIFLVLNYVSIFYMYTSGVHCPCPL